MKVKFTENSKRIVTISEAAAARKIIEDLKEDDCIKEYGQMAAHVASGSGGFEILKAEAEIAKNTRIYNWYSDDSGNLDVWLHFYAFNSYYGFYEIGIYLTDIHSITGDNQEEIRNRMYINSYQRRKI